MCEHADVNVRSDALSSNLNLILRHTLQRTTLLGFHRQFDWCPRRAAHASRNRTCNVSNSSFVVVGLQRTLPGFRRQFAWCLGRAVTRRVREPLAVFTDYAIFALTGDSLLNG